MAAVSPPSACSFFEAAANSFGSKGVAMDIFSIALMRSAAFSADPKNPLNPRPIFS